MRAGAKKTPPKPAAAKKTAPARGPKDDARQQLRAVSAVMKALADPAVGVDAVAQLIVRATRDLAGSENSTFLRQDGDAWVVAAVIGDIPLKKGERGTPTPGSLWGRAVLSRQRFHYADSKFAEPKLPDPEKRRTRMAVPIVRDDEAIGVLLMSREDPGGFDKSTIALVETFADQLAVAMENARLLKETKEALEQQTATSEVLKAVGAATTDVTAVFEAIVEHVGRLCDADDVSVTRVEGMAQAFMTHRTKTPALRRMAEENRDDGRALTEPPPGTIVARALAERRSIHVHDIATDPEYPNSSFRGKAHTMLVVPMLKDERPVGVIFLTRNTVRPFDERQIALVEAFARQGAIAIENVRLFNETKEALEQQTATAEVLQAISTSTESVQPVFDAVVERAAKLCDAEAATVSLRDGDGFRVVAAWNLPAAWLERSKDLAPIDRGTPAGRAYLEGRTIHWDDFMTEPGTSEYAKRLQQASGARTVLAVPIKQDGAAIGVIVLRRTIVRPFAPRHIALVETFAGQAAIAIENVRLFNETKDALDRQTASGAVLRSIADTRDEVRPVLQTIVDEALRLCAAETAFYFRREGDEVVLEAIAGTRSATAIDVGGRMAVERVGLVKRAFDERRTFHTSDLWSDETRLLFAPDETPEAWATSIRRTRQRSRVAVPVLSDGEAIGVVRIQREQPGGFTPQQIALVESFAAQAAIAIRNVRLFNETKEALDRQTAMSGILSVISSSPTDVQPVLDAIAESARRFCAAEDAVVAIAENGMMSIRAHVGPTSAAEGLFAIDRTTVTTRAMVDGKTIQVADLQAEEAEYPVGSAQAKLTGHRTTMATPLLREGQAIGAIVLRRAEVKPFTDRQVDLLRTFADQAVIAIENVRLFNETKEALERETATNVVLKAISDSGFDLQPMFEQLLATAAQICRADYGFLYQIWDPRDIRSLRQVASFNIPAEEVQRNREVLEAAREALSRDTAQAVEAQRRVLNVEGFRDAVRSLARTVPFDRSLLANRVLMAAATVHVAEITEDPDLAANPVYQRLAVRALLGIPMISGEDVRGVITLTKKAPGPFEESAITLVESFAAQAMIAIENVRLFNETTEALDRQTATSGILSVISSSPTDVQPVLDAIAESARRFCAAEDAVVAITEDGKLNVRAHAGPMPPPEGPFVIDRTTVSTRSMLEARTLQVADIQAEAAEYPIGSAKAKIAGQRTTMATPLLREGKAIGAILLRRAEVRPFSDKQVDLLRTFADQAVIAIENVRLFNETKEALERQTAISEILRVISSSPTDVQPVLGAIAASAARFCAAENVSVILPGKDGLLQVRAHVGPLDTTTAPWPIDRTTVSGRSIVDGRTIQVPDLQAAVDEYPLGQAQALELNERTSMAAPLVRDGRGIGALLLRRGEVRPFTDKQIRLVETFADQAVIAIENVRLFNETKESLERQTALSEILQVISKSPTDTQPVFETIARNAARYCQAEDAVVQLVYGDRYRRVAHSGSLDELNAAMDLPLSAATLTARVLRDGRTLHVPDLPASTEYPEGAKFARAMGVRCFLTAPLLREGRAIGSISLRRREAQPFTDQQIGLLEAFAAQAVIAIENVRLFNETKEALEQQTATAEVLKVISTSPSDLQPVFDAIADRAATLCGGERATVFLVQDGRAKLVASTRSPKGVEGWFDRMRREGLPLDRTNMPGRAVLARETVLVADVLADPEYDAGNQTGTTPYHTVLAVPLLREGVAIGAIGVTRTDKAPFGDRQIALIRTFADQAVIAIENVRHFNETKEALERQTALAEILRVISQSPTDVQPVLDAIVESAARFCAAEDVTTGLMDGEMWHIRAHYGPIEIAAVDWLKTARIGPTFVSGRSMIERRTIHLPDLQAEADQYPDGAAVSPTTRAILATPLLSAAGPIGAMFLRRTEPTPFTERQIALAESFAAQAVIAIENVRLFNETKDSLERQTATAELLKVISRSTTDLQPVFDTIVQSVVRLCDADYATFWRPKDDGFAVVAGSDTTSEFYAFLRTQLVKPERGSVTGRALLEKRIVQFSDASSDPELYHGSPRPGGARSALGVPILRGDEVVGLIGIGRMKVRPFNGAEIALVQSFADQALIAIENVRLFNETTESLERQTALGEILQVIASSPTDQQPVLDAIVRNAVRFCGGEDALVTLSVNGRFTTRAHHGPIALRAPDELWDMDRTTVVGRAVVDKRTVQSADTLNDTEFSGSRESSKRFGFRAVLATPLLREGVAIGGIALRRSTPGVFSTRDEELLRAFAAQAVIALENVRLFNETNEALAQQTATADVLQVISRSAFDLSGVFRAMLERAVSICNADWGSIQQIDGDALVVVEQAGGTAEYRALGATKRYTADRGTLNGRALLDHRTHHVADVRSDPDYRWIEGADVGGFRTALVVPMLRDDRIIGSFALNRGQVRPFSEREIRLVETFARQAVIAIENVRLFDETKESLDRQTAVSDILKVISASPTDIQPVLDAIAESAARFTGAEDASVLLVQGEVVASLAHYGPLSLPGSIPLDRGSVGGTAVVESRLIHVEDVTASDEFPISKELSRTNDRQRTVLAAPLIRDGKAIGIIVLRRREARLFTDRQVDLVQVFADQAVIAIENVRLFNETKEALERQTATGNVLDVISRSAFDIAPVLQTIADSSVALCRADHAGVFRREGDAWVMSAISGNWSEYGAQIGQRIELTPESGRAVFARAVVTRRTVHIPDVLKEFGDLEQATWSRTRLAVPILREGEVIGVIRLGRARQDPFSEREIALVESFATQAAIAMENVRLFKETQVSLERQTATAELLAAMSQSAFDLKPVFEMVLDKSLALCKAEYGWIRQFDVEERTSIPVAARLPADANLPGLVSGTTLATHKSVMARAYREHRTVHVADITADPTVSESGAMIRIGARTGLGVPLLRGDEVLGVLILVRIEVRPFEPREIELVESFARQAAIAIENVRLFKEIQQKSAQLEMANRHKTEFLANMSHELRTPLNAIIGFSDVLLEKMYGELNEQQAEYLDDIKTSGTHLLTLINDILDLSKIEAGRMELELAPFSLVAALNNAVTLVRERAQTHGIKLELDVGPQLDMVVADERKVKQVVVNLLANAVKFTPDGGTITLRAARENGEIRLAVHDTGIGIATKDQERIFEEFQQAGTQTEKSREGTGLGLTLSKRMVELHGGTITVDSAPGKGSTFTVALPLLKEK